MKKFYSLFAMAALFMMTLTLSSCHDDDEYIAYTLEGTWEGNMYMSHEYNGRTFDATYSVINFDRNPYAYSSGVGYWIDYYQNAGWGRNYVANHIDWTITNGVIRVYFREEGTSLWIEDYRLTDNRFTGRIYDGSTRVDFSLIHTSSPNWYNYDYGWYDGYYYAPAQDGISAVQQSASAPKRVLRAK